MKRLVLIDGSGYIFRAFYALPPMTRADGTPVNAVYGFTNMLLKQSETIRADGHHGLAVIFDAARRTFRNDIYPDYKANRAEPPEDLIPQFSLIKAAPMAFNLPSLEKEGFEADDLIATYTRLARMAGIAVTIISSDKDLMQLVGEGVEMYDPVKNQMMGRDHVRDKFGVDPEYVVDVQALAGDASDNVPGVPGIGPKTAAQLINQFGTLDALLEQADTIKQPKRRQSLIEYADQARLSRELVRLRTDAPIPAPLETLTLRPLDPGPLLAFLDTQGFRTIAARVRALYGENVSASPSSDDQPPAYQHSADTVKSNNPQSKNPKPDHPKSAELPFFFPNPNPVGDPGQITPTVPTSYVTAGPPKAIFTAGPQKTNYSLVTDKTDLADWIKKAQSAGRVALDTETTGLDAMRAALVGISLSVEAGTACYIPLAHQSMSGSLGLDHQEPDTQKSDNQELDNQSREKTTPHAQIPLTDALDMLKPLLGDPTVLKIGHNLKYDMLILARYGVDMVSVSDSMVLSYVLDAGQHGHGLDELAAAWFDHQTIKYGDVVGVGKSRMTFDHVPATQACDYAAEDADMSLRLHSTLKPRLVIEGVNRVYETLERPLIPVLVAMEQVGVKVDSQALASLSEDFSRRLDDLSGEIYRLAGRPFTIASPKQLGDILFTDMGLPGGKKGKSGAYATGARILEDLAAEGHQLPAKVLIWRQLAKLKSTYTDALVQAIHPQTGRVHTSFGMASAATGRLSSNAPNLQNIPARDPEGLKIRRAFVAEPGHVLLSVDYSQIELRLLAHVANIAALKQAFHDGQDIHAMTASRIFGAPVTGMNPLLRRRAKAINFGIIYGISAFGLARQLNIPRDEASQVIKAYFAQFPGIQTYMEDMKLFCRQHGYVRTLFGRKIYMPEINDKNAARRGFAERAAINAPLQGAAADIIKRAMIRLHQRLPRQFPHVRMLLQVHDELVFEMPEAEVEEAAAFIRDIMEKAARPTVDLSVPLIAETGWADDWAAAH